MSTPILLKRSENAKVSAPNNRYPKRAAFEFYPTPPEATRALLSVESFQGDIWEPACGDGAISKVLEAAGYQVVSTDLIDRGYGAGGHNFLKSETPLAKNIITNPPYGTHGLGDAFVRRALIHARKTGGSVAMLLNLRSLCHPDRTPRFQRCPPTAIYVLDDLTCWPEGKPVSQYARIAKQQYYWAVWHPGKVERPSFWWLATKPFRDPQ
ncbi:hypothetical protein [Sulfitobacter geojensis]|uniref:hypothetical protein n=3 Tax=Sulfitobacter geojensis TaxID=1342299 RepID=UPI001EEDA01E|nr:hypothetical protein [Sulfitobacter geojensis]